MTIKQVMETLDAELLTPEADLTREAVSYTHLGKPGILIVAPSGISDNKGRVFIDRIKSKSTG